jgi:hypothetical protein
MLIPDCRFSGPTPKPAIEMTSGAAPNRPSDHASIFTSLADSKRRLVVAAVFATTSNSRRVDVKRVYVPEVPHSYFKTFVVRIAGSV